LSGQAPIDEGAARRVRALALDGIELVKEPKRFYPQRELAGHVLGSWARTRPGGLERELDQYLRGKSVQVQASGMRAGPWSSSTARPTLRPHRRHGDAHAGHRIQLAAEKELATAVKNAGRWGWALVLDVNTGAVSR